MSNIDNISIISMEEIHEFSSRLSSDSGPGTKAFISVMFPEGELSFVERLCLVMDHYHRYFQFYEDPLNKKIFEKFLDNRFSLKFSGK